MHGNLRKIDNAVAKQQWRALYDVLTDLATVRLVLPQPGSPDMVFTANAGLVKGRSFIVSRFRYPERQGEEPYFADWFMDRGYDVSLMPRDVPFEGAGDALFDRGPERLWMAHGHRSIQGAREILAGRFGVEVVVLKLTDTRFYHLDTCFCPLEGGYLMYFPPAFDEASRAEIQARVPASRRIAVAEEDALAFACNAVNIDRTVVVNRATPAFVKSLAQKGFDVVQTPLSEFMKAGGSAKCLTLRLDEP
jgi:N-dimethylarginine dimethylaminohydrolase